VGHGQKIQSFGHFSPQTGDFRLNRSPTPIDFERIFEKKITTHKNSYTGPSCITDKKYGPHAQEIQSFGQFLLQTGNFW
jgi:hypothetical protein